MFKENLNVIHYGSYYNGVNDIVNVMADDLSDLCNLKKIDLKLYSKEMDERIKLKSLTPNGNIAFIDTEKLKLDVNEFKPNFIILNAGGLCLEDEGFKFLKRKGIITVGIELSDPDVFPYNGKIFAHKFDLFYTNAKFSLINQYDKERVNIKLLPFAASMKHHFYMSDVEKIYDLVVVGGARPDRIEIINKLNKCKIGLYGSGWNKSLGVVNGLEHIKAINSGKMYLSFSKTSAGYENVKVGLFEAIACKSFVITNYMDELNDYFEIGKEIVCYKDVEELPSIIEYYLKNEKEREEIREAAYNRFLNYHTYKKRWEIVIDDVLKV